jgi:hypothetical protein
MLLNKQRNENIRVSVTCRIMQVFCRVALVTELPRLGKIMSIQRTKLDVYQNDLL